MQTDQHQERHIIHTRQVNTAHTLHYQACLDRHSPTRLTTRSNAFNSCSQVRLFNHVNSKFRERECFCCILFRSRRQPTPSCETNGWPVHRRHRSITTSDRKLVVHVPNAERRSVSARQARSVGRDWRRDWSVENQERIVIMTCETSRIFFPVLTYWLFISFVLTLQQVRGLKWEGVRAPIESSEVLLI